MSRILQVCNTDFYLLRFLAPLVRALVAHGHTVECACEASDTDSAAASLGVVVHPVAFPRTSSALGFMRATAELRRLMRKGRYDCVDSHNRNASIVARIAAWLEAVPINLYTAHGFYFHDDQGWFARAATLKLEGALARITSFTLSQSNEDAELMLERGYLTSDRIAVIGNGINTSVFRPGTDRSEIEQRLGLAHGRFRIASVGRLVRGKGFADLLRAFAQVHSRHLDVQLLLIGGNITQDLSPFRQEFEAEVRALGLSDEVVVTGIVDGVRDYLAASDVFVLPSYREGMPRALLEAMSMGLAVIATDIRGCREAVAHGRNGLLYPAHNVEQLIQRLEQLLSSPSLRANLGRAAHETVLSRFDEGAYISCQVEVIDQLLASRNPMGKPDAGSVPRATSFS